MPTFLLHAASVELVVPATSPVMMEKKQNGMPAVAAADIAIRAILVLTLRFRAAKAAAAMVVMV